jgi:hypothetical protein
VYKKREKIKVVIAALKGGKLLYQALSEAGIKSRNTWFLWERSKPRLKALRENAQNLCDAKRVAIAEDALMRAVGEGNTTALIFFLTNRAPERWADRRALVNNTIVNKVGGNGSFTGEDREFAESLRRSVFPEVPKK